MNDSKILNDDGLFQIALPPTLRNTYELPDPALLQHYKDMNTRTIWLISEVNEDVYDCMTQIIEWNREDAGIPVEERKPIKLIVCSPGGSIDCEESFVSLIKISKTPIYGIAIGCVASAASLIYLSCHKHYALRNTYMLLHRGSCDNIGGSYDQVQSLMSDYKVQIEKMETFYIENTKIPEETIREKIKTDWYVRGEQLIEYGLVDEWIDDIDVFL